MLNLSFLIDYDKRTYDFLQDIPTYESIADD